MSEPKWESIHLNHKDRALHGFYAYHVDSAGVLHVLKNGRVFTDQRVHDFITKIAIPFAADIEKKAKSEPHQGGGSNG